MKRTVDPLWLEKLRQWESQLNKKNLSRIKKQNESF